MITHKCFYIEYLGHLHFPTHVLVATGATEMLPHVVSRKRPGTHVSIAAIASVRHKFATKEEDKLSS